MRWWITFGTGLNRTSLPATRLVGWIGIGRGKFYQWRQRYGMVNEHNAWVPRDFWLEDWERAAIIAYFKDHPDEGYRRLTYMMMDADIVAVSPSSVYRVLQRRRTSSALERQALEEGHRVRSTARAARALARGRVIPQHMRHLLLPVQPTGRLQPVHRELGDT